MKQRIGLCWLVAGLGMWLAATPGAADILNFEGPLPVVIPDNGTSQQKVNSSAAPAIATLNSATITISHHWLGDLTAKLIAPNGVEIILFDRVGEPEDGSAAMLGRYVPSNDANELIPLAPEPYSFAASGEDFTAEAQRVVDAETWLVRPNRTYGAEIWGAGPFPAGVWQLIVTDAADQDGGEIASAQINYTPATSGPTSGVELDWPFPADIVYGTPLGPTQLNATATANGVPVPGVFAYQPPAGTILQAGIARTLSVTFTPQDLTRFAPVSATMSIQVKPATLVVSPNLQTKRYGDPLPVLTAQYSGFVNGDTPSSLTQPVTLLTTATVASPVGTYPITASGGASANYSFVFNTGTLTVTPAPLVITADNKSMLYGSDLPAFTATYSGFANGESAANLIQPVTLTTEATSASPAGTYPIAISAVASPNYTLTLNPGTLTIAKGTLIVTVTADNKAKVYGAPAPQLTATYSGFANGDTAASLTQPVTLTTTATAHSPVGTYPITASGGASPNYTLVFNNGILTVTPAPLTVTAEDQTMTYGGPMPPLTAAYSGFVNGDTASVLTQPVSFSTTASPASPVGSYAIVPSGGFSPNYEMIYRNGALLVARAVLTVTADNKSKVYGAPLPPFTATYTGFVNGDTAASLSQPVTFSTAAEVRSPVGQHQIRVSGGASPNYTLVLNNGILTISPAPLTVTADSVSKAYGAPVPALTATYTGFASGDTPAVLTPPITLATSATSSSPVGSYPITIAGGGSPNYLLELKPGTLQVVPAPLEIIAEDKSIVYGAALPQFTARYSGFVKGDGPVSLVQPVSFTTTANASSPAGTYPISVSAVANSNYAVVLKSGVLTVAKAPLTVTPNSTFKVYGAGVPALTVNYTGFVNGDSTASLTQPVDVSTTATAASPVRAYPITVSGGASDNYSFIYNSGTLTVTPAPLVITADNKTMLYGTSLPAFTATYSGFVNGDNAASLVQPVTFSTEATPASPTGTYPIRISAAANPNYTLTLNPGVLTVTKATLILTVTADNKTKVYGAPVPPLTVTYSGFMNGDSAASLSQPVTLATTATARSPVGTYPITVTGGASANYALELNNGVLTVTPAPLTVSAEDKVTNYGAPPPAFTAVYKGFVNGDTAASMTQPVTFSTTATLASPVGTYAITPSGGMNPNYHLTYRSGALLVARAVLTITADNKSKVYGAPLPALTASYKGFVNGDGPASLAEPVTLSTAADSRSPAGQYQIRASGGASGNYNLVLNNGVLTIDPAPLTVTADSLSKAFGAPVPSLTVSYSGFVNGDTPASLAQLPVLRTEATAKSPIGSYPISVSGGAANNYDLRHVDGVLTVLDPNPPPRVDRIDFAGLHEGQVTARVTAPDGVKVRLESSADLRTWTEVGVGTSVDGQIQFRVTGLDADANGFFRAIRVNP